MIDDAMRKRVTWAFAIWLVTFVTFGLLVTVVEKALEGQ